MTSLLSEVPDKEEKNSPARPAGAAWAAARPGVRLSYAVAAVLLAGVCVAAARYYGTVKNELTEVALARRGVVAQLAAATLSERLDRMLDLGVSLATRGRFAELVAARQWDEAIQIMKSVPAEFRFVEHISLNDVEGNAMVGVPAIGGRGRNLAQRDWYQGVSSTWKPYVSGVYRRSGAPQRNVFAVAVPMFDRSKAPAAILVLQIQLESFFDWAPAIDPGPGGTVYVLDGKGAAAFDSRNASPASEITDLADHPAVARLMRGESGVAADADRVYAFMPGRHGWDVVVEQPAALAFAARNAQLRFILVAYALGGLFVAAAAWLGMHELGVARRALARHTERLRILREIDRAMASDTPTDAIAAAVIQPLRKLLEVPRVHVNLIDYAAGEGLWLAAAGRRRTHVGAGVRFPLYMLGDLEALKRGEPQTIDAAALPASPQRDALLASGVQHYLVTPMIARGELIGALSIGAEHASFPASQATVAEEAATQLAIAIMDARLSESVRRTAERLRIVHEIDRAIISEVEPGAIAGAVLQPLRELLAVPRVVVNLFDLAAGEVEWLAAAGRHHTRSGPGVRYSLRFMGDIESLGRGELQIIDTDALPEGDEKRALLASGVRHYMAVPMIAGRELIGAVSFGGEAREFPSEQVAIVQEVATQIAIAISQARLLEQVRKQAAELELRVQERTAELEAANQELASFSYSVSHDLRAPLRAMDGYARMLEEDYAARLDDEGRRLLKVVRDNAGRMGRLIDDLLDFSRLGRQPMALHAVDMGALAREVVDETRAGQAAGVELGELPAAHGDLALLKQVWLNLVSNAFKYSAKQAAPRIEIGGRAEGAEHHYWVRDNGAGFDMRYADKLFGVFQRLHRAEEFPGTGVGLAIVQRVIARHRGRVWAESAPGAGACFHFSLPRETT